MNTEEVRKVRCYVKLKDPNPLFKKWLTKWKEDAQKSGSAKANNLEKALQSLIKFPLPLETGRDCIILKGFGKKLCKMLDDKLIAYNRIMSLNNEMPSLPVESEITNSQDSQQCENTRKVTKEKVNRKRKNVVEQPKTTTKANNENELKATSSQSTKNVAKENLLFAPDTFDVILLVDVQETNGKTADKNSDLLLHELSKVNAIYEIRHLKVGDYLWVARERQSGKELVLPYIIERKRIDDFASSIKDGRFHEQKFRLKQSKIENLIYLIEGYKETAHVGLPEKTLYQAATNTLIQDKFTVKYTYNLKETVRYFSSFGKALFNFYKRKHLTSIPKDNTPCEDDFIQVLSFPEFQATTAKNKNWTVQEMFIKQLLQIKSLSIEKAMAVVENYPTPFHLKQAFDSVPACQGEKLLAGLEFGTTRKKIGPVLSKTIFLCFTSVIYPG